MAYEAAEFDDFQEALDCYNSIQLQEKDEVKTLRLIVVDEDDCEIFEEYLFEEIK